MASCGAAGSRRIGYLTDVEGNWEYVLKCILLMPHIVEWEGDQLALKDGCMLVFGGDAGDKRDGTLRFVELMVNVKRRYPDRVFLIVGNRDANKLRLLSELHPTDWNLDVPMPEGVTGDAKNYRTHLRDFLSKKHPGLEITEEVLQANCNAATKLRWILDCTMGSGGDFESRRKELALLRKCDVASISDDAVVENYLEIIRDGGILNQFLRLAHLAVIIDQHLFVHGGVMGVFVGGQHDDDSELTSCIGYVPGHTEKVGNGDVRVWIDALNQWFQSEVEAATADPLWKENRTFRNGWRLISYGSYTTEPSIIMAKSLNTMSQPVPLSPSVCEQLRRVGIVRVVCGHTPHGTCPTLVRGEGENGVEVLFCDTSYSDMKADDNRGAAAAIAELMGTSAHVWGILPDNRHIEYVVGKPEWACGGGDGGGGEIDPYIGKGPYDGYWVKAKYATPHEPKYLLCKINGRDYSYKDATTEEVKAL